MMHEDDAALAAAMVAAKLRLSAAVVNGEPTRGLHAQIERLALRRTEIARAAHDAAQSRAAEAQAQREVRVAQAALRHALAAAERLRAVLADLRLPTLPAVPARR